MHWIEHYMFHRLKFRWLNLQKINRFRSFCFLHISWRIFEIFDQILIDYENSIVFFFQIFFLLHFVFVEYDLLINIQFCHIQIIFFETKKKRWNNFWIIMFWYFSKKRFRSRKFDFSFLYWRFIKNASFLFSFFFDSM